MKWPLILCLVVGCAPRWRLAVDPSCRHADGAHAADRVHASLAPIPFTATHSREAGETLIVPLVKQEHLTYLAVRSFPEVATGPLHNRCFLYDQALALLWMSWSGERELADGIANTLALLQREDGAWGFSFDADTEFYNQGYLRTGAVAWAAWAMTYHAGRSKNPDFEKSAQRARQWVASAVFDEGDDRDGLVSAGSGVWTLHGTVFDPARTPAHAVTEHQLDAWMALSGGALANSLAAGIVDQLWLDDEGRFALAIGADSLYSGRALDASGAWGALFLDAIGQDEKSRRSLDFTETHFSTRAGRLAGYRPYLDVVDHPATAEREDLIFVEGSMAVGLAGHRLGRSDVAQSTLELGATLSCLTGGALPYANRRVADFTDEPSAAASFWFLFLEREMRTGERAPVFTRGGAV